MGLALIALILCHVIYQTVSYILFYYNPLVGKVTGFVLTGLIVIHIALGIYLVAKKTDSKKIDYPKMNIRTILQRASALLLLILFPVHTCAGGWITGHVGGFGFFVFISVLQVLFWAAFYIHITTSFSNALITLGIITSMKTKKKIDVFVGTVLFIALVFAAFTVIKTQFILFNM